MTQVIDFIGGEYRNRTGVHGFAIRCVTTPPTRRLVVKIQLYQTKMLRKARVGVKAQNGELWGRKFCGTPIVNCN